MPISNKYANIVCYNVKNKRLKIFVVIGSNYAKDEGNPFVPTLENAIMSAHEDVEFSSVKSDFWEKDEWDIVHVMWPDCDCFASAMRKGCDLRARLTALKNNGTKIVATIHNMHSHHTGGERIFEEAYRIVYSLADVMIHLGQFSYDRMVQMYPEAKHVIIPHHVYDTLYTNLPTKDEALRRFGYKDSTYALCMGTFRHKEERQMVCNIMKQFPSVKFVIPKLYGMPKFTINASWIKERIKLVYYNIKYPNLYCTHESFVPDDELPYYFALSDVTILQRLDTLNSGNLPLGMLMGNVIVGPNVGNMGHLLDETGNFAFAPDDIHSMRIAMENALAAARKGKGADNRKYALTNWSTQNMAEKHYALYKSILMNE